jgi:hypothetical protein
MRSNLIKCGSQLLLMLLLMPQPGQPQSAANSERKDSVLISVDIDRRYDDSEASLGQISLLFDLLPPTQVRLSANTSLSQLILEHYGISDSHGGALDHPSDQPETYRLLLYQIRVLNSLDDANLVPPGNLLIPTLPPRVVDADQNYRGGPLIITSSLAPRAQPGQQSQVFGDVKLREGAVINEGPSASDKARVARFVFRIPLSLWQNLFDQAPDVLDIANVRAQAQALPLSLVPGVKEATPTSFEVSPALRTQITSLLSASKRRSTVFILDSGWPSAEDEVSSRNALREIFDVVSDSFRIEPVARRKPAAFVEPGSTHCKEIAEALQDFRRLDASGRVRVVYVPLSREQDSSDLLREMVFLGGAIDLKRVQAQRESQDFPPSRVRLDKSAIKYLKAQAKDAVASLPASLKQTFSMNSQVLQALLTVANVWAAKTHSVFFLNQSWTVATNSARINFETGLRGLAVAAVGNDPYRDVYDVNRGIDFARRSYRDKDVVAVMALNVNGNRACSSFVNSAKLADAFVVGYSGSLRDGRCGTSFAAPRIAWLLAAKEASRADEPKDADAWALELFATMKDLRPTTDTLGLLFNPAKYLAQIQVTP